MKCALFDMRLRARHSNRGIGFSRGLWSIWGFSVLYDGPWLTMRLFVIELDESTPSAIMPAIIRTVVIHHVTTRPPRRFGA
jgi:hypothetical protein